MDPIFGTHIHIDQHLTNIAINWTQPPGIAANIAPTIPVQKQSDIIPVYNQADYTTIQDTLRTPGTEANKITFSVSSETYFANNYALKKPTFVEQRANADPLFVNALETDTVNLIMNGLMMDEENRVAALYNNTANVGTSSNVASSWLDLANSSPYSDINTMLDNSQDSTGYKINTLTMSEIAWRYIRRNNEIINKVGKTALTGADRPATIEGVADLFNVDKIHVGAIYKNTNQEGGPQSLIPLWGFNVHGSHMAPNPSRTIPSYAYNFNWVGPGLSTRQVERHPFNPKTKSDEIEVGYYQAERIVAKDLSFLITNVTSSQ